MFVLVINGGWETVTGCKNINREPYITWLINRHHMTEKQQQQDNEYLWKYIFK